MKKNKGFTLIELLAIIVILAIIAVITVPIILNIIDNSKKGAVKDSAYGYKDAVNKYYVSKLAQDKNYTMPNGAYSVTATGTLSDGTNTLTVAASGKKPSEDSWVTIIKNKIVYGCLQFDEYKVDIVNGILSEATVGTCSVPSIASCPGCVYAYYTSGKSFGANGTGSVLTNYVEDYRELNKTYFLGHILDENDKIVQGYVCGIKDGVPFCIDPTEGANTHAANTAILQSEYLWNGSCTDPGNYSITCSTTDLFANAEQTGFAQVGSGTTRCSSDGYYKDLVCGTY